MPKNTFSSHTFRANHFESGNFRGVSQVIKFLATFILNF